METTNLRRKRVSRSCEHLKLDTCLVKEYFIHTARPIVILDRDGVLAMTNAAASEALSLSSDETGTGSWWSKVFAVPEETHIKEAFTRTLREGSIVRGAARPSHNGRVLAFEMVPLHDSKGDIGAAAVSFDDITEQTEGRRLSEALNEMQEAIGSTLDLDTIMQRLVDLARATMHATSTIIAIKKGRRWQVSYVSGDLILGLEISNAEARRTFPSLLTGEITPMEDVLKINGLPHDFLAAHRIRAGLTVPLWLRGRIIGLLIFNFSEVTHFSPIQLDYVRKIGAAVSLAIENSDLLNKEKKERQLMQRVIEQSPASIALLTYPKLRLTMANEGFHRVMRGHGDFMSMMKDVSPSVAEMARSAIDTVYRTGEVYTVQEMPVHLDDGSTVYWNLHVISLGGPMNGDLLFMATDVTALVEGRKRIEDLVRVVDDERAKLEAMLQTLPVGVLLVDVNGKVLMANQAFRSFFEFTPTAMETDLPRMEGRWSDTGIPLKPNDWPIVRALRGERVHNVLVDVRRKDHGLRTVIVSASPVSRDDEPIGAVLVYSDITDQRHTEQEAVQAKSRMELYLDLLSHDINNLNAGAKGYVELLLEKGKLVGRTLDFAQNADSLLEDISQLVENVRKLQKVEAEGHNRTAIDLSWLLDDVASAHRFAPSRDVSIYYELGQRALVHGNELLRDVFDNIIGNAIKHTKDPVEITITKGMAMVEGREYYRVDVVDNGPGIPDPIKPLLFNRMQRGRTTAKGHGLGLYLAKTVLDMFGGMIWADDRVPGDHTKGSRFVVLLPVAGHDLSAGELEHSGGHFDG